MPSFNNIIKKELTAGGGTYNVPLNNRTEIYVLQGANRLTSNWTVQPDVSNPEIQPVKGMKFTIINDAVNTDLNGNTVTVFHQDIDNSLMAISWKMECLYDGSQWIVQIFESVAEEDSSF